MRIIWPSLRIHVRRNIAWPNGVASCGSRRIVLSCASVPSGSELSRGAAMQTLVACVLAMMMCGQAPAKDAAQTQPRPEVDETRKRQLEEFAADAAKYEVTLLA